MYKVDPRHGTNDKYKEFVSESHKRGLKVVMDMVFNHVGLEHWFIKDIPSKDWIHFFPEFTRSNFRAEVHIDPYASEHDKELMNNGWFDTTMPDLNQKNPFLARYLIQNSIWWIEFSGIDGIRMDTQPYPDQEFMATWAKEVLATYPDFKIVGESWLQKEAHTAYWAGNAKNADGYNSNLSSVTDFPMYFAMTKAFVEDDSWTDGLARLYYVLTHDFMYPNAQSNLIFLDNHDLSRFYSQIKYNLNAYKMAISFLLTTRGTPQLYMGTEILMTGIDANGHGNMRKDFPGGWASDKKNKFTAAGRSKEENMAFSYTQKLLNWRKSKPVIHTGKLTHFVPENGVYVYFRHNAESTVMVILNNGEEKNISTGKYKEFLTGYKRGLNVIEGLEIQQLEQIFVPAKSALILELLK
ncbi:MAG TPA: hypothetical protein DCQ31_02075 [Bacteroidales bacterium]|nr:hypothetical protein [Bacteroidales bacterium]